MGYDFPGPVPANFIRKIPGFRSGKWWKRIIAGVVYLLLFLLLLSIITPSAPTLALEEPKATNQSSVSIEGKTYSGKPVFLLREGETVTQTKADSEGKFIFTLNDLNEGKFSYKVQACDSEKQRACRDKNILVEIDKTPPSEPIIAVPKELPEIERELIIISGKTEPESKIKARVGEKELAELVADENGNFEIRTGLNSGSNTISLKAVDKAGNESQSASSEIEYYPSKKKVRVTRVIDGDTVEIEGGERIRYIGINTPENYECYYQQATNKNRELVEGKEIIVEKDISEQDQYWRLLRYVWLDNIFVNEELVKQGYAQVSTYPPDVKYQDRFLKAQREAREQNKGLWGNACNPTASPEVKGVEKPGETPSYQPPGTEDGGYKCNCSKTCSQMSSCKEAYYQLNNCGCSARDGDGDGVPCESICPGGNSNVTTPPPVPEAPSKTEGKYSCNCSKTCSQMASCEEAYYQLTQRGCSQRDGDNDGVPCESICPEG